jgi:hypothetical protein
VDRRRAARRLRRPLVLVAVALLTGTLVAGVVGDVQAHIALGRNRAGAAAALDQVRASAAVLRSVTAKVTETEDHTAAVQRSVAQVGAELTTTKQRLAQAAAGVDMGALEVGDAHACAGGVSRSATALEAGSTSQAITALRMAAPACESMFASDSGGPLYPFDFADPDVLLTHGTYFAYGTNSAAGNIQIMESPDLAAWKKVGDALPTLASWARPGETWAPAVIELKKTYLLYYAAARRSDGTSCISVATATRPQGPFTDSSRAPLVCQPEWGGSIDPDPYVDKTGRPYLAWKSNGGDGQPATIWAESLSAAGTTLVGRAPVALLRPDRAWEGSVVEAPSVVAVDGGEDLFYSGNNWDSSSYAIGFARCAGPLGPCTEPPGSPLLASQAGTFVGPGGESVFVDGQGRLQMAFAAWLPGAVGYPHSRLLFLRPLAVVDGVPEVVAPA